MRKEVEKYLRKCAKEAEKEAQEKRAKVLIDAGLYEVPEITEEEFDALEYEERFTKQIDGEVHFYHDIKVPLEVTDEEYAAILATNPSVETVEKESAASSGAASFFTIIAWLLWILGLIASIAVAVSEVPVSSGYRTYYETKFSFSAFFAAFITYFLYGCLCMCAAELFKKLQSILNTLRSIKSILKK